VQRIIGEWFTYRNPINETRSAWPASVGCVITRNDTRAPRHVCYDRAPFTVTKAPFSVNEHVQYARSLWPHSTMLLEKKKKKKKKHQTPDPFQRACPSSAQSNLYFRMKILSRREIVIQCMLSFERRWLRKISYGIATDGIKDLNGDRDRQSERARERERERERERGMYLS